MKTNQEKLKLSISELNNDIEKELEKIEIELALTRNQLDCLMDRKIKMREIIAVKNAFEKSWRIK
jgi:hypothetical protein